MTSAAERLAANMNIGMLAKASELKKRLLFVLGALVVYRIGTYIPIPGVDPVVLSQIFQQQQGGVLGVFNMFSGGALGRMTIFALAVMPYISASIIVQLLSATIPSLAQLKKEGDAGRRKINQYTRYGTVVLALAQSLGIAVGLESMQGPNGGSAVMDPGLFFRFSTMVTLTGGTLFLMWLGEQITARGIGQGISLIIFTDGIRSGECDFYADLIDDFGDCTRANGLDHLCGACPTPDFDSIPQASARQPFDSGGISTFAA